MAVEVSGASEPVAIATQPDFAFHTLGWMQFQRLCDTVLAEELGQTVQSFEPGNDGGRDAAFFGRWQPTGTETYYGSFTFQVKFSSIREKRLTRSTLQAEIDKAISLHKSGLADNYFIITNLTITGTAIAELEKVLREAIGCRAMKIYGTAWLTQRIRTSDRLRILIPQVYGIGYLDEIIDQRQYQQTKAILESLGNRLRTVVSTEASDRAARALRDHGFALLVGDPMSGKTTISSFLAAAAADCLKLRPLKIRSAEDFALHWNTAEDARQFFWIDDAFGQNVYDARATHSWNRHLDALSAAIKKGATILMSSRGYIWREARQTLRLYEFPLLTESQVVVDVAELSESEKSQILYNHLRCGNQSEDFKKRLIPYLQEIAQSRHFLPEAARRLSDRAFTKTLYISPSTLLRFFEQPMEILLDVVGQLDPGSKALLALIFVNRGELADPGQFRDSEYRIFAAFGADERGVRLALQALDGSLVERIAQSDGSTSYRFSHPTLHDAIAELTAREPQWLNVYLAGASTDRILLETSAGEVTVEGVRIVIPPRLFPELARRLDEAYEKIDHDADKWGLEYYLRANCSRGFYEVALRECPSLFDVRRFTNYTNASDDEFLRLCARLQSCQLLSAELLSEALERMRDHARISLSFLIDDEFSELISAEFRRQIEYDLRENTRDRLDECRSDVEQWCSSSDSPDQTFKIFFDYAAAFRAIFPDDDEIEETVQIAEARAHEKLAQLREGTKSQRPHATRSIIEAKRPQNHLTIDIRQRNMFSDVADPV